MNVQSSRGKEDDSCGGLESFRIEALVALRVRPIDMRYNLEAYSIKLWTASATYKFAAIHPGAHIKFNPISSFPKTNMPSSHKIVFNFFCQKKV